MIISNADDIKLLLFSVFVSGANMAQRNFPCHNPVSSKKSFSQVQIRIFHIQCSSGTSNSATFTSVTFASLNSLTRNSGAWTPVGATGWHCWPLELLIFRDIFIYC